jgi:hypothetical protein
MITTRTALRSTKKLAALLAISAGLVAGGGALSPSDAAAASYARACYTARGVAIRNLTTTIQYYSGGWRDFRAPGKTDSNGCVSYTFSGSLRRYPVRVYAIGLIYSWNVAVDGFSYHYAPAGNGRYRLGTRYLTVYNLATPSPITNACSTSAAMMLACWADQRGITGDTVVPNVDHDGDGYFANWDDADDNNKYIH